MNQTVTKSQEILGDNIRAN